MAGGAIDGVTETNGLTMVSGALPDNPKGSLGMMDDQNAGNTSNFKVVNWPAIAPQLP